MSFQKLLLLFLILFLLMGAVYLLYSYRSHILIRLISLRFSALEYKDESGKLLYRFFSPGAEKDLKYPLVVYLHGGGSGGSDNLQQLNTTLYYLSSGKVQARYPAFILAPQCPAGKQWLNTTFKSIPFDHYKQNEIPESNEMKMIVKLIRKLLSEKPIDSNRIYVMGFSMGSSGTWDIISRYPGLFAAAVPMSGVSDTTTACNINIPVWAFHGRNDEIAPVRLNFEMQSAINSSGGNCKLTVFEDLGHSCEKQAVRFPGLIDWLFTQKKTAH